MVPRLPVLHAHLYGGHAREPEFWSCFPTQQLEEEEEESLCSLLDQRLCRWQRASEPQRGDCLFSLTSPLFAGRAEPPRGAERHSAPRSAHTHPAVQRECTWEIRHLPRHRMT